MSIVILSTEPTGSPSASRALYVPAGDGITRWFSGDVYTVKATAADTNGSLGAVDASVPPGGGLVPHTHPGHDEIFYLFSGALEFLDGENTFVAGP
jgi:quercetin dioxygenase-like cupin family protein